MEHIVDTGMFSMPITGRVVERTDDILVIDWGENGKWGVETVYSKVCVREKALEDMAHTSCWSIKEGHDVANCGVRLVNQ